MEDIEIIDLYWARSQQAITESQGKYGPYCQEVAMNILRRHEDAEECVNDTWLKAWNAIPPQRPARLRAFFAKLTRNLSLDRWRGQRAEKRGGGQVELALEELTDCLPARDGVEEALDAAETGRAISRFLWELPALDRRLFVRRYWHLEGLDSLARRYGLTEGQVKSRLHRIRKKLKQQLEKEGIAL